MASPKLKAVVVESGTVQGEFSLRVIKDTKQVPLQLHLRDAGFIPGDIVHIGLLDEFEDLEANYRDIGALEAQVDDLNHRISQAIYELDG